MTSLQAALNKLRAEEGYGEQDRDIRLTEAELNALVNAATAVLSLAAALQPPTR